MSFFDQSTYKAAMISGHHPLMPHWLTHLGGLGLFSVAVIDSSVIPLPLPGSTDLLLLWLAANRGSPYMLAFFAISGSIVGGYSTWHVGRRGGESALRRYLPSTLHGRIVKWIERHPFLLVFVPAMLPPPLPVLPFTLAAGALGVTRRRFLLVYGAARSLRYSLISWLGVVYGRNIVRFWSRTVAQYSTSLLYIFFVILVGGACFGIWKIRDIRKAEAAKKFAEHIKTIYAD